MHQNTEEEGTSNQPNFNVVDSNAPSPHSNQTNVESPSSHSSTATKTLFLDEFHVFSWMNTHIEVPDSSKTDKDSSTPNFEAVVSEILLQKDLQEIDDYLLQATSLSERFAYKASPRHTRKQFYDVLIEVESKVQADQSLQATYELQVELANAAETLFVFFLSPQQSGPTIEKYWGPLAWSLDMRDAKYTSDCMESIGRQTEELKELVSGVPIVERCKIKFSDKLPRAWLHLLMALAFSKDIALPWSPHMRVCLKLMKDGVKETIQQLSNYQLSDYVVFTPFDVASLMTFQLSQDLTGSCPDICETYVDYMGSLEFDIDADPINREHQGRITDLKQEISIILETLETQREILNDAQKAQLRPNYQDGRSNRVVHAPKYEYKPSPFAEPRIRNITSYDKPIDYHNNYGFDLEIKTPSPRNNQWSPDNSRGIQGLLFRESLALIEERIEVFRNINDRATYLEDWNLRSIDANKDRQETAIYAFTIVTIIFLPLSTVASILGMNTNGVRNTELTQWLFWVIAIPLTLIIIGLVLIWSEEWHNFRSAFSNLWGKKTKRRHLRLPEDYARVEPMTGLSIAPKARASGIYPGYYPPPPGPVPRLRRSSPIFAGRGYAPGLY
ncbi:hypothetical protein EYC80_001134 [Monilinia laxa]|uniref:Mg2+ transporter protein, CorA-like/Zinc transport protein ZntB n=1 Tax=Monilinia laxa TaxID=61186 RepID=A0A5N6K877_MONLA|nr:hypothetical protein EYC80_001134 [Monilinia laxa]